MAKFNDSTFDELMARLAEELPSRIRLAQPDISEAEADVRAMVTLEAYRSAYATFVSRQGAPEVRAALEVLKQFGLITSPVPPVQSAVQTP
jgi:hypothetical protein